MDLEAMARQLMEGENAAALRSLTESGTGARLAAQFDGKAAEAAVKSGDREALGKLLQSVLSTPEGRSFAAQVQEAMNGHGR